MAPTRTANTVCTPTQSVLVEALTRNFRYCVQTTLGVLWTGVFSLTRNGAPLYNPPFSSSGLKARARTDTYCQYFVHSTIFQLRFEGSDTYCQYCVHSNTSMSRWDSDTYLPVCVHSDPANPRGALYNY